MKRYLILIFAIGNLTAHAQSLNKNWKQELNTALTKFQACNNTPINGINPCNRYLGESLKIV